MVTTILHEIDAEHPDYPNRKHLFRKYQDLYTGGEQMRANAADYLSRRQKEPGEIYAERVARVFYENYIGSIIDWYVATLFRREPLVIAEGDDTGGRRFLNDFAEDCDLRGTSLTEFFRNQMTEALIHGSSHFLVDFPRASDPLESRAAEERAGTARAYLNHCSPDSIINWSLDERGSYDWVVLKTKAMTKASPRQGDWRQQTRWMYFDRQRFEHYHQDGKDGAVVLIDSGLHGLASQNRVPLFSLRLPEGLWLMNRAGLLQLEHFNKSNALSWALTLGLFATPVLYSDREWNQILGESYYLHLAPQDRFGWTEPEGRVYQIAADNLTRLQEEIYRVCYMLNQAGGSLVVSGLSKQRDYAITQEVLRAFGDMVKETIKGALRAIVCARQDDISVDVTGLEEFDIGDLGGELADARDLLMLGINSPTLRKQVYKKLALKYLCDARPEIKDRIADEIERFSE